MTRATLAYPGRSGRYILCDQGKLHPLHSKARVNAVAIVWLRFHAVDARRSKSAIAPRPPFAVDLNTIPSNMEMLARSWSKKHAQS